MSAMHVEQANKGNPCPSSAKVSHRPWNVSKISFFRNSSKKDYILRSRSAGCHPAEIRSAGCWVPGAAPPDIAPPNSLPLSLTDLHFAISIANFTNFIRNQFYKKPLGAYQSIRWYAPFIDKSRRSGTNESANEPAPATRCTAPASVPGKRRSRNTGTIFSCIRVLRCTAR